MHEGVVSTGLGLPGKPAIAEEIAIARDLELVRYADSRLHFTGISSRAGLDLIRNAKRNGLKVSCSVTPYHLIYCDEDLRQYDTNLKVNPPLRTAKDRDAIREAVLDGTVDCIASHHSPQDTDHKVVEFEYAKPGMISLQTSFAAVCTALPGISAERLVELFYGNAARIFDLTPKRIDVDEQASLTLFSLQEGWTFGPEKNLSRSRNTPFFGFPFTGKPLGIINKDRVFLSQ
jgi:dihydroorotase